MKCSSLSLSGGSGVRLPPPERGEVWARLYLGDDAVDPSDLDALEVALAPLKPGDETGIGDALEGAAVDPTFMFPDW